MQQIPWNEPLCQMLPNKSQTKTIQQHKEDDGFMRDTLTVDSIANEEDQDWVRTTHISGSPIPMKLDTGAQLGFLS